MKFCSWQCSQVCLAHLFVCCCNVLKSRPGFLLYCFTVLVLSLVMIYIVAPRHGRSNPIVFVSICSMAGSVSVMAVKGFGVAVKLTFGGNNQFTHLSTYAFMIVMTGCIVVQMNYFNKALDTFSTNVYVRHCQDLSLKSDHLVTQSKPNVLCRILELHYSCLLDLISRVQYNRRDQHGIPTRWVCRHIPRCTPTQPLAQTRASTWRKRPFST